MVVLTVAASLLLAGCGASAIGGDNATTKISVTNDTGVSVDAVKVKLVNEPDYGDALLQSGYLDQGATCDLFVDAEEGQLFDISLSCINGASYELHDLELADMADVELKASPSTGLGYATYTSVRLGDEINTLPAEQKHSKRAAYEASLVGVSLDLSHATVKVGKTTYKKDADIKVVGEKRLKLTVKAKEGYELSKVSATCAGAKVKVKHAGGSTYVVSASQVTDGLAIKVVAKKKIEAPAISTTDSASNWNDSAYYPAPSSSGGSSASKPSSGSGGSSSNKPSGGSGGSGESGGGSGSGTGGGSGSGGTGDDCTGDEL